MKKLLIGLLILRSMLIANETKDIEECGLAYLHNNFTKAFICYQHHEGGNSMLGVMYSRGEGVTQNFIKAAEHWTKACDINAGEWRDDVACQSLGRLYIDGQGVQQNYAKANELFSAACDMGNFDGCRELAVSYKTGRGGAKDINKTPEYQRILCDDHEDDEACEVLRYDFDLRESYGKACALGDTNGCENLIKLEK